MGDKVVIDGEEPKQPFFRILGLEVLVDGVSERHQQSREGFSEKARLVTEVPEDGRAADPGHLRDIGNGSMLETSLKKERTGGLQDPALGGGFALERLFGVFSGSHVFLMESTEIPARLRVAFHAMPLEAGRVRVPGWTVVDRVPSPLTALSAPTLVQLQTGVGPAAARRCVAALAGVPVEAALLGGFAGALAPDLEPGTIVVADRLLGKPETVVAVPMADELEETLSRLGLPVARGPLVSVDQVVGDPVDKSILWRDTGAIAADMESAVLGEVLSTHAVPFGVARVVLDGAHERLPASASIRSALAMLMTRSGLRSLPDLVRVGTRVRGCTRLGTRALEAWLQAAVSTDSGGSGESVLKG